LVVGDAVAVMLVAVVVLVDLFHQYLVTSQEWILPQFQP
jgi:hypothetical protein